MFSVWPDLLADAAGASRLVLVPATGASTRVHSICAWARAIGASPGFPAAEHRGTPAAHGVACRSLSTRRATRVSPPLCGGPNACRGFLAEARACATTTAFCGSSSGVLGVLARRFARFRCQGCTTERPVASSCINVHVHALVLDCVFARTAAGQVGFIQYPRRRADRTTSRCPIARDGRQTRTGARRRRRRGSHVVAQAVMAGLLYCLGTVFAPLSGVIGGEVLS